MFKASNWIALFAPAGTPAPVVSTLSSALQKSLKSKEMAAMLDAVGGRSYVGTTEELRALLTHEHERVQTLIKASGLQPQKGGNRRHAPKKQIQGHWGGIHRLFFSPTERAPRWAPLSVHGLLPAEGQKRWRMPTAKLCPLASAVAWSRSMMAYTSVRLLRLWS